MPLKNYLLLRVPKRRGACLALQRIPGHMGKYQGVRRQKEGREKYEPVPLLEFSGEGMDR